MSRLRTAGGWLVGGLFVLLAVGALPAGDGITGTARGALAAAILLAAAGLAIPRTRTRIGDASGKTIPTRVVAVLLVVGLVAGIGVAPAVDPGDGPGSDGPGDDGIETTSGDTDGATPEEAGTDDGGSDPEGEETPAETATRTETATETERTESPVETDASTETETPAQTGGTTATETGTSTETATDSPDGELRVRYLDVGQADATIVEFPNGETLLVDSGDWRDDGERVLAALREQGVERIDHLVSTHAHADHVGGHEAVIETYESDRDGVGAVYDSGVVHTSQTYERYLDAVERHDVTLYEVREGDGFDAGEATVEFLNPPVEAGSDLHANGVALTITYGERSFLFTGDAEETTEARLVEVHGDALAADVYQVGHHGSATSSSDRLLDAADPEVAVISSARDSQYGHPHEEVLAAFADRGIETYWTAVHGDVVVTTDGWELSAAPETEFSTDPDDLREERGSERRGPVDPTVDIRAAPTFP